MVNGASNPCVPCRVCTQLLMMSGAIRQRGPFTRGRRAEPVRAVRFHAARDIRVEDVPPPGAPAPGEVLVEPSWTGICGTDLHEYLAGPIVTPASPHPLTGATLPQILGHEFSAKVMAVGEGVSLMPGDRVAAMPLISCGCRPCVRGDGHLCVRMACTGLSSDQTGVLWRTWQSLPHLSSAGFPTSSVWSKEH